MIARLRRAVVGMVAAAVCIAGAARSTGAQASPAPGSSPVATVAGRVLLAVPGGEPRPLAGTWVALNRVGGDSAGVIDSLRSAADGSYRFAYRRTGDPDAIYFADASYAGVGYFTEPLRALNVSGEDADIVVFDTISAPAGQASRLRVRGRHLVVGPPGRGGRRPIVEVFELTNDTAYTVVPASDTAPVWSTPLIAGAEDADVGDGDIGSGAVHFRGGRAELHAPIAPGLRQLSVHYTVPGQAFPLTLRLPDGPEVLEVLIAGRDGEATGAGLHGEAPVTMEEQPYVRFVSPRARAGDEVVVRLAGAGASRLGVPAAIGATVLILGGALVYARRTPYPSVDN